jgi:hypothetical protein
LLSAASIAAASSGVSLPWSVDRGDDDAASRLQLAQVGEALVEQAQLDVVEAAGHFLAVAGDEGHGRAFVEQGGSGQHLRCPAADFFGDPGSDSGSNAGSTCPRRREASGGFMGCRHGRWQSLAGAAKGPTMQNRAIKFKAVDSRSLRRDDKITTRGQIRLNCRS